MMTLLVHARDAGIKVIDGPYGKIRDVEGFRETATRSRALGFDGKWVLHPDQIAAANVIFGIAQEVFGRASDILDSYEHATGEVALSAVMFGDEMIDEASRKMAEANVVCCRAQGLEPRPVDAGVPFDEQAKHRAECRTAALRPPADPTIERLMAGHESLISATGTRDLTKGRRMTDRSAVRQSVRRVTMTSRSGSDGCPLRRRGHAGGSSVSIVGEIPGGAGGRG